MDMVIFTLFAVFVVWRLLDEPDVESTEEATQHIEVEDVTRVAKLNETFYDDPDAFMDIAHELGFPKGR